MLFCGIYSDTEAYLPYTAPGTFAVVSLMVGSAVDKGLRSHGLVPRTWNETVTEGGKTFEKTLDNSAELLDMKLKYAMAVTFAVGVLQV